MGWRRKIGGNPRLFTSRASYHTGFSRGDRLGSFASAYLSRIDFCEAGGRYSGTHHTCMQRTIEDLQRGALDQLQHPNFVLNVAAADICCPDFPGQRHPIAVLTISTLGQFVQLGAHSDKTTHSAAVTEQGEVASRQTRNVRSSLQKVLALQRSAATEGAGAWSGTQHFQGTTIMPNATR